MKKPLSKSEINITFVNSVYTFKLVTGKLAFSITLFEPLKTPKNFLSGLQLEKKTN